MAFVDSLAPVERPRLHDHGSGRDALWQAAMKEAVRTAQDLCRLLDLPQRYVLESIASGQDFPVFVPLGYLNRMRKGDPHDPLLRQVLPARDEDLAVSGFIQDPVGDGAAEVVPGLLHKYRGRALLITTGACAVHCRYCFRRHYPYNLAPKSLDAWQPALQQIAKDRSIREIIFSGGDPLTLVDPRLSSLAERLAAISHVQRLRIHSRLPVMIPERITDDLLGWLTGTRLTPWMVIHANHAAEIDERVARAVARLVDRGVPVLNQAVLLAGVNDSVAAQVDLWERLINIRVLPYYLHQLDPVAGAAHFAVPREKGQKIVRALREQLPGYAIPRFVEESPGARSKVPIL